MIALKSCRGLAINMVEPLFDCPSIGDILLQDDNMFQKGFLQNLPSVVCGHALNPQPHHSVLGSLNTFFYLTIKLIFSTNSVKYVFND